MVRILFDIDGVLNPYAMESFPEHYQRIHYGAMIDPVNHGAWLRDLETRADLMWSTAWEDEANDLLPYYGIEREWEFIHFISYPARGFWKLPDVRTYLEGSTDPVIWLDDEFEQDAFDYAAQRGNLLVIAVDPEVGWSEAQYRQMLDFIRDHEGD
jgi:hypothetical protein